MTPFQIRSIRKALGLSVKDFASKLGFTGPNRHVTVYRWETNERTPSTQTIMLIEKLAKGSRKKQ